MTANGKPSPITSFQCHAIAVIHSPLKEKFATPRQSGLVPQLRSTLELLPPYNRPEAVAGLEGFSHLWLQFLFHLNRPQPWQPMVRPPRLGGNRKVGVFASRAPYRPNPIGLSVVEIHAIHASSSGVHIDIGGADLVDGTPILDIKPYIPYSDSIPNARSGFAPHQPTAVLEVRFTPTAEAQLRQLPDGEQLTALIRALLEIDPRPAYRSDHPDPRSYGTRINDLDIHWRVRDQQLEVLTIR